MTQGVFQALVEGAGFVSTLIPGNAGILPGVLSLQNPAAVTRHVLPEFSVQSAAFVPLYPPRPVVGFDRFFGQRQPQQFLTFRPATSCFHRL